MTTINDYIHVPYVARGRDIETGLDCWGLVRHARTALFGSEPLPILDGLEPDDKRSVTRNYVDMKNSFRPSQFTPGAIACAFMSGVCVHVGIVVKADGRLWVLETDLPGGVSLTRKTDFEDRYTKVEYFND